MGGPEDRESRIEGKLDKVVEDIGNIKVTLTSQHMSLEEHMRRTALLEEAVRPMHETYTAVKFIIQLMVILSTVAGIVVGVVEVLNYIRGGH